MALDQASIIQAARDMLGNSADYTSAENLVPDEAITPILAKAIRKLNRVLGASSATKEVTFSTVPNQAEYQVSTVLGTGVGQIVDVVQAANLCGYALSGTSLVDPRDGRPYLSGGNVEQGFEASVMDVHLQQERARLADQQDFEEVIIGSNRMLRLYPCPYSVFPVVVRYQITGTSIADLPDVAETALQYAVCVGILLAMINRYNSLPRIVTGGDPLAGPSSDPRLKALQSQLKEYRDLYDAELLDLQPRG